MTGRTRGLAEAQVMWLADLRSRQLEIAARVAEADADQPVPYTLTPQAEAELDAVAEAERYLAPCCEEPRAQACCEEPEAEP
jgi:hypothetical protein